MYHGIYPGYLEHISGHLHEANFPGNTISPLSTAYGSGNNPSAEQCHPLNTTALLNSRYLSDGDMNRAVSPAMAISPATTSDSASMEISDDSDFAGYRHASMGVSIRGRQGFATVRYSKTLLALPLSVRLAYEFVEHFDHLIS